MGTWRARYIYHALYLPVARCIVSVSEKKKEKYDGESYKLKFRV